MNNLTAAQKKEISHKLKQGAVSRASTVSLFFSFAFILYGYTSLEFLQHYDSSITLWSNIWPRILLNGMPFLFLHFWFKTYKSSTNLKILIWSLAFPSIFISACLINVWPIMMMGHPDLYLYVHAANFLILIMGTALVSPPPKYLISIMSYFALGFLVPVSLIFYKYDELSLLRFFLNDAAYGFFLAAISSMMNFSLRQRLATEDVLNKNKIEKFVGNLVSESIFENNESLMRPRTTEAFLISMDIRGFTRFSKVASPALASTFKEKYHALVAKAVGDLGGFIHKTQGDGHLISVGLVTENVDLSDIPGVAQDAAIAEVRKRQQLLGRSIIIFERILGGFAQLKNELDIQQDINVCAAIDFGEIGLKLLGDANVRLEFDIEGLVVIRCSRLETYTKTLRDQFTSDSSYLVLSTAASEFLTPEQPFQPFATNKYPIKDFPDEALVFFREYPARKSRRSNVA